MKRRLSSVPPTPAAASTPPSARRSNKKCATRGGLRKPRARKSLAADLFAAKLGAEVAVSNKELGMDILGSGVVSDQSGATFDRQV